MPNIDFICDTEECAYWLDGECEKKTSITIQAHCCCDYEVKEPAYQYSLIAGIPMLLSEVFVTVSGGTYYKARLLGYGAYGGSLLHETYCVEVFRADGHRFVDFFCNIYSRKLEDDRHADS